MKLIRCPSLPGGGGFHIKETGILVVSRWDVNCRVWFHLGCLDEKLLICSLSYPLVCSKKFTKNARTLITQKSTCQFKPKPHWSTGLNFKFEIFRRASRHFYVLSRAIGCVFPWSLANGENKRINKEILRYINRQISAWINESINQLINRKTIYTSCCLFSFNYTLDTFVRHFVLQIFLPENIINFTICVFRINWTQLNEIQKTHCICIQW